VLLAVPFFLRLIGREEAELWFAVRLNGRELQLAILIGLVVYVVLFALWKPGREES